MANATAKTTATAVAEPTVVTSGYTPELTQRVYVPGLGDATRSGEPRVKLGFTKDGRKAIQFSSSKRGQGGYGASKLFAASDCERFGAVASALTEALMAAEGQGLLVEVEAFEAVMAGGKSLWRISAFTLIERQEREAPADPWGDQVRQAQQAWLERAAAAKAAARADRSAQPATGWQTAPLGDAAGDDSLPF